MDAVIARYPGKSRFTEAAIEASLAAGNTVAVMKAEHYEIQRKIRHLVLIVTRRYGGRHGKILEQN